MMYLVFGREFGLTAPPHTVAAKRSKALLGQGSSYNSMRDIMPNIPNQCISSCM